MLRVFCADISALSGEIKTELLSDYRREKLEKLKNVSVYRQSLAAELLLIRSLDAVGAHIQPPLDIVCGEYGRPELRNGEMCFSLSHSGDRVLCALSDGRVGADIQINSTFDERLAKRFFAECEYRSVLAAGDRDFAFTMLWSLKESYLKRLGTGLYKPLGSFEVCFDGDGGAYVAGDRDCLLSHTAAEGFHVAVCSCTNDKMLSIEKTELQ